MENGVQKRRDGSTLWRSRDGREWEKISIISNERCATETAFDFLQDERIVAFVRHDCEDCSAELKTAVPPYSDWTTFYRFPFRYQGPCLKRIGNTVVLSGRVMFEDEATPLLTPDIRDRQRGLLIMTVDVDEGRVVPAYMLPHDTGTVKIDGRDAFPDISYAGIVDPGSGKFTMSYYEGYKIRKSWVRMAVFNM